MERKLNEERLGRSVVEHQLQAISEYRVEDGSAAFSNGEGDMSLNTIENSRRSVTSSIADQQSRRRAASDADTRDLEVGMGASSNAGNSPSSSRKTAAMREEMRSRLETILRSARPSE
jgi:hypothetical protein